jgi:hypothetical protein
MGQIGSAGPPQVQAGQVEPGAEGQVAELPTALEGVSLRKEWLTVLS